MAGWIQDFKGLSTALQELQYGIQGGGQYCEPEVRVRVRVRAKLAQTKEPGSIISHFSPLEVLQGV